MHENIADHWLKSRRSLLAAALASKVKTNVNSACDVTDLDQIEPISVQDV